MARVVRSIDDLTDAEVRQVLDTARTLNKDGRLEAVLQPPIVGLVFLETSLRTRLGFAAATLRLGGNSIEVDTQRSSPISMAESIHDTLRTVMGYADLIVVRPGVPLNEGVIPALRRVPIVSGGDRGPAAEHPSQALIDTFAIENEFGDLRKVTVGICGDPRMRSVTSLLRLLARPAFRPRAVTLIATPGLYQGLSLPEGLGEVAVSSSLREAGSVDFLYVAGIPHGAANEEERTALRVTLDWLDHRGERTVVSSPLPVIDEIDAAARGHPRVHAFRHSDDGLFVRMALLYLMLGGS